jgi:hypothetical protein
MARQFVDIMSASLATLDNNQQATVEYERLAWSGDMKKSQIFLDMTQDRQTLINFRDQIESDPTNPNNFALADPLGIKNC